MFIRTERLFLRPGWPEDWREVFTAIADEGVVRNLATAPWPYTEDDAQRFVRQPQEHLFPHFIVTLPGLDGARIIGCGGLNQQGSDAELGYWIARDYWGRGFATEAARAILRLAAALGHKQIVASHFADNAASGRVLEKAGFVLTGSQSMRFSAGRQGAERAVGYVAELTPAADSDSLIAEPMAA